MLNLQIVPFMGKIPDDEKAKIVLLRARPGQGSLMDCPVCSGTGTLPRGEGCRKCSGRGQTQLVRALRWDLRADQYEMAQVWMDGLHLEPSTFTSAERKSPGAMMDPEIEAQLADSVAMIDGREARIQRTIRLSETGGGETTSGSARIICGLHGEPLRSMGGRSYCGGEHAIYYAHAAMVCSYSHHRGTGGGKVEFVGVDRGARHNIGIVKYPMWRVDSEGQIEVCPENHSRRLEFPQVAWDAAIAKSRCYHCRSAFYAVGQAAGGPSGALRGAGAAFGGFPSPLKGPGIGY